ncbi:MAG: enoyl-CoA hydratase-related protein, partial [Gammaproteobacteria bacterium]|nr:enoyl-CoA hydratase-related protein [Gammaproteobacteria bacterium]
MNDAGEVRVESLHGDGDGDGVAVIRLCRAAKLNALDARMLEALEAALSAVEESSARAVIVTGEGKLFCAGGD